MLTTTFIAVAILMAISAFFSGSETALTAVSRGRMHQLEKDGSRAAANVNRLVANRERMIGSVLLGNTFINILASSLMTAALEDQLGPRAVAITTGLMTVVILIFAEVMPKTLAIARTDRFALFVAVPLRLVVGVLAPIVATVQWVVWRVLWLFGVSAQEEPGTEEAHEEIRGSVELHHREGNVEREHRDMIGGILDLRELTVGDVMLHRTNMDSLDADLPRRELLDAVIASHHSRVPLWRGEPENIVGVLSTKHVALALLEQEGNLEAIDVPALAAAPAEDMCPIYHVTGGTAHLLPQAQKPFRHGGGRIWRAAGIGDPGRHIGRDFRAAAGRTCGGIPSRCAPQARRFLSGGWHRAGARSQPRIGLEPAGR